MKVVHEVTQLLSEVICALRGHVLSGACQGTHGHTCSRCRTYVGPYDRWKYR